MNYIDKPIEKAEDDFLGRSKFAKDLAKAISTYSDKDSLVLGLMGPWGSGKTSIINLVEKEIQNDDCSGVSKPIMSIKFEPWNISNQDNLIGQFFSTIRYNLERSDISGVVKKQGRQSVSLRVLQNLRVIHRYLVFQRQQRF